MRSNRNLVAAVLTFTALGLLAAVALWAGSGEPGALAEPAAAPTPEVRTEVVRRTVRVRPTARANEAPSPAAAGERASGTGVAAPAAGAGSGDDDDGGHGDDDWEDDDNAFAHVRYSRPDPRDVAGRDYDARGRVTAQALLDLPLPADAEYRLCGPDAFVAALETRQPDAAGMRLRRPARLRSAPVTAAGRPRADRGRELRPEPVAAAPPGGAPARRPAASWSSPRPTARGAPLPPARAALCCAARSPTGTC